MSAMGAQPMTTTTTTTQTTVVADEPLKTPANSGAKTFFAVVGLGVGWWLYQSGTVQELGPDDSFRPPYRFKTTYMLYATTALGYLVGTSVGNILYGNPNKPAKQPLQQQQQQLQQRTQPTAPRH